MMGNTCSVCLRTSCDSCRPDMDSVSSLNHTPQGSGDDYGFKMFPTTTEASSTTVQCLRKSSQSGEEDVQKKNTVELPTLTVSTFTTEEKNKPVSVGFWNVLSRIDGASDLVVGVSSKLKEIIVWNVNSGSVVSKISEVDNPTDLKMIDTEKCVVLCNRQLVVYDLMGGAVVSTLKGVMNVEAPYFGLAGGGRELVSLSRNRMSVNLMNVETGELVTSFKAGEDRFLNSLLVSADGRILVCGDETQTPYRLLVWELTSRKLKYDLRLPSYHQFITRLAAITDKATYLCCVARDTDEEEGEVKANFVVVYDLQSGTLFKKWHPGVDCCAVCVCGSELAICGHDNGAISVWHLITGARRWWFEGHTSAISSMKLNPREETLLSCDNDSIRLWDLAKGELIGCYEVDEKPCAMDVLDNRRLAVAFHADEIADIGVITTTDGEPMKLEKIRYSAAEVDE